MSSQPPDARSDPALDPFAVTESAVAAQATSAATPHPEPAATRARRVEDEAAWSDPRQVTLRQALGEFGRRGVSLRAAVIAAVVSVGVGAAWAAFDWLTLPTDEAICVHIERLTRTAAPYEAEALARHDCPAEVAARAARMKPARARSFRRCAVKTRALDELLRC